MENYTKNYMFDLKMALKTDQDGPETAPRRAKSGPRAAQSRPEWPERGQEPPKSNPRAAKGIQERPKGIRGKMGLPCVQRWSKAEKAVSSKV